MLPLPLLTLQVSLGMDKVRSLLLVEAPDRNTRAIPSRATWQLLETRPADWAALLSRCGAGFFHSPASFDVSLPPGDPFFGIARDGEEVVAVALGTRARCRLSRDRRHFALATPPATSSADPANLTTALAEALRLDGAAEVLMDSFDCDPAFPRVGASRGAGRIEQRVELGSTDGAELARTYSSTHRRHVSKGEREGFELRTLTGEAARELLFSVQTSAADRASRRGDPFALKPPPLSVGEAPPELDAAWGTRCYAVFAGDQMLSVALIGWGNDRTFYLLGGSSPEGYRRSSAVWLHWRIMTLCAQSGHRVYNFGGTPAAGEQPEHPAHGLFRFKSGFGSQRIACGGSRWTFRPAHLRAHKILAAVEQQLQRVRNREPMTEQEGKPDGDNDG